MTDQRSRRSCSALTDEHLDRLLALGAADDLQFRRKHPKWANNLLACCLVQGGARHYLHGDRGIKDFDIYLFYEVPHELSASHFPWNRGGATRNRDFGTSEHGRQLYTAADWADAKIAPKIPKWERYAGRRVDIMSRAIAMHPAGAKAAVQKWLQRGSEKESAPNDTDWNLSRTPVICLYPDMKNVWWSGPEEDEAGIEKGVYSDLNQSAATAGEVGT